jgi:hypothetical protein
MRGIAEAFGVAWLTLVAIAIMVAVVPAQRPWVVACTSVAAIVVALAAATRWWPALVAAPLAFVTAALPFAILVDRAGYPEAVLSSVVVGATCAWLVQWKRPTLSRLVGIGLAPFTALAAVAVMQLVLVATAALTHDGWVPSGQEFGSVVPWTHLTVLVAAVGLLSLPGVRIRAGSVALVTLALMVSLLVPLVAAAVLGVATLAGAALATRVRCDNGVVIAVSLLGVAWASSSTWAMSATLAVVGVNAILIARRQRDATVAWGLIIAPIAAALAVAVAAVAASVGDPLAAPMAMAAAAGTSFALERAGLDVGGRVLVWVVGVSTVATAMVAGDGRAAGLALTVSSLAWLALAARGRDFAKWWCAVTISLGIGLIFADAGVTVIEAYTLVPAAAAIVLGIMWMRAEPEVRSLVALWPGLALALVPSYCALAINPDSLLRTIALTLAIVVLALLAVKLRWFALVVATATTALTVSALQIIVGSNLVLRLVSFAVVGSLLLAIASWFEKIKTLR